jgi:hypothetical protein
MRSRITTIVFRDVLANLLLGFVVMALQMLPWVHEPTQSAGNAPQGSVLIEACWPDGVDADIDTWVVAPGDVPVGFKRRDGKVFSLLRDDIGKKAGEDRNCELAIGRALPAGEYVVNLHLYSSRAQKFQITVAVTVILRSHGATQVLRKADVVLRSVGDEVTVVRWRIDARGSVVAGSVGTITTRIQK